jgi:hypothetical protein
MGIEVSLRDIKKLLPLNCPFSQFLGSLCHYIKPYLGEEHTQRFLVIGGIWNAFISTPIPTTEMWDDIQSAHIKTLSCSFVIMYASKRANIPFIFQDIIEEVMESLPLNMPLHLRITAWHDDQRLSVSATSLDIGEIIKDGPRAKTSLAPETGSVRRAHGTAGAHCAPAWNHWCVNTRSSS